MAYNERCSKIRSYVTQLIYYDGKNITEDIKPQNEEEQKYFEKYYKIILEDKQKTEQFYKNLELAEQEAEQEFRKYTPKEYWSDGYFSFDEFEQLTDQINNRLSDEIDEIIQNKKQPAYSFLTVHGRIRDSASEIYITMRFKEILKKEYSINWENIYLHLPKKYYDKIEEIEKKYDVNLPDYK